MLGSLGKLGGESAYQFGPNLGVSGDSLFVAWREWDGEGDEDICCRLCCRRQVTLGPSVVARARVLDTVQALLTADGAPRLVWVTVCSGHGTVCEWQPARGVAGVPCLSGLNCGELSVAAAPDGACWLAAQVWGGPYPTIQLSRDGGGQWAGLSLGAHVGGFAVSPVLAVAPSGTVLVVWAEYVVRAWRLGGVLVRGDRAVPLAPLAVPGHDLLCPAVVCDGRGAFHLACCLERPVLLEGGDVSRHSRIVTATLDATRRAWDKDPEESCIDYAMNPWMAGYAGRRRRPSLVGDPSGGAWVFFEEKLDPDSMSPGPGRLVMRRGGESPEVVVLTGQSGYHVAPKLSADGTLAVVSRFQAQRYGGPPPTCELHAVSPAAGCPPRPAPLPDNSHASLFVAAAPADATARPACEGELRLFFGDPHLHSRLSGDLEGEQEELYLFARDTAGLDFVAFTENDYVGFTHPLAWGAWERSKRNADFFNVPGTFTALVGWEYTLHAGPGSPGLRNSHRSVLFPGADGPVYRWFGGQAPTPEELVKLLRGRSVLLHHHHASGYDITDDRLERNIEVCSG